jgi:NAD(P)-dependent dehydrogenase (short-subunit alcohol dehydrogenase family)
MLELAGRGVIVTGTRRLGAVVVQRLAREGLRPAIVYRSSRAPAEELAESARALTDRVALIQGDLTVEADVKRMVETAKSELGDLSFSVNLAADYPRVEFENLDLEAWERGMSVAKVAYLMGLHVGRALAQNSGRTRGQMIFFGDWAAEETPYHDYLPYLSAKAAIHFMVRAFALELAPQGILVNAISPGPTGGKPENVSEAEWTEALASAPLHRESSEEDMAELITTLLKLETITGENIRVDSGRHIVGTMPKDYTDFLALERGLGLS